MRCVTINSEIIVTYVYESEIVSEMGPRIVKFV